MKAAFETDLGVTFITPKFGRRLLRDNVSLSLKALVFGCKIKSKIRKGREDNAFWL
jgi:hypothetical protein